jgi:hypothetical protein
LAGAVAFNPEGADAEGACHFVTDGDSTHSGRDDAGNVEILELLRKSAAKGFCVLGMLENQGALNVGGTVKSARQLEMTAADGADLLKNHLDLFAFHLARPRN